jgi:hypothetical protein
MFGKIDDYKNRARLPMACEVGRCSSRIGSLHSSH